MVHLVAYVCVFLLVCFPILTSAFGTHLSSLVSERLLRSDEPLLFFADNNTELSIEAAPFDSIAVDCTAAGSSKPTIYWIKDGNVIQGTSTQVEMETGTEKKLRISSTESRLYLDCLNSNANGEYICVAKTPDKEIRKTINISVTGDKGYTSCHIEKPASGEPARIYMWSQGRLDYDSRDVQLFCRASGSPTPDIKWYDSERNQIKNSDKYSIGDNGDLLIRNISWVEDEGVYVCSAQNEFAAQGVSVFLFILLEAE